MKATLENCEIFRGMEEETLLRVLAITRKKSFETGEHPFLLGQRADDVFVVLSGRVDLRIPISVLGSLRDVTVESKEAGDAIGWSAFVRPHRYRLSARAAEPSELAVLPREGLERLFAADLRAGWRFMQRMAEVISERLLAVQALWARELQRSVSESGAFRAEA